MAGKSKAARKKKSQTKKRLNQELQTQVNQRKKKDEEVAEVLVTNGAEPEPPNVDEDAGKDIPMETLEENVERTLCKRCKTNPRPRDAVLTDCFTSDICGACADALRAEELAKQKPKEVTPQELEDEAADLQLEIDTKPKPFDPKSLIADILKKKKE